jgi:putative DNA primase/helicase
LWCPRKAGGMTDELAQLEAQFTERPKHDYDARLPEPGSWRDYRDEGSDGPGSFNPARLAVDIAQRVGLTRGPGGDLWYDAGGYYAPGGEDLVRVTVQAVLDDKFKSHHQSEVLTWCKSLPRGIDPESAPPENMLNLKNGVLDLDTMDFHPGRRSERFTYQLPVEWNPYALCPQVDAFLSDVVPEDCVPLLLEVFAMCVLNTGRYRRAVMLLGGGGNGKSNTLSLLRALLGERNTSAESLLSLTENRFASAELFGKLANVCGDIDSKPIENSGIFKTLTGGARERVRGEKKFQDPFTFVNTATLIFSANDWPVSHDQSNAYFTRWVPIPFPNTYVEGDAPLKANERRADETMTDRITARDELQGLLVKVVEAAVRLRERGGFSIPKSSRESLVEYREWADTVVAWAKGIVSSPGHRHTRKQVYEDYSSWCKSNSRGALGSNKFWPKFRSVMKDSGTEFEEVGVRGEREIRHLLLPN